MSFSSGQDAFQLPTARELVAPIFRQRRTALLVAVAICGGVLLIALGQSPQYEAEMKILVKRERADPLVSTDATARPLVRTDVTDDDLNSEVELLKSRDLLEQVALAAGLHPTEQRSAASSATLAKVVQGIHSRLKVTPIRRTAFIRVSYRHAEPATASRVLTELARLYPEKHLALHRPTGAYDFFTAQAEHFRQELMAAQGRLTAFGRDEQVVSADVEKQNTLQRLADFEAELQTARGSIADATRRIAQLEADTAATPARHVTQIRTSDNRELVSELKSRVLQLEVKHAEMLRKFAPSYPPAVEVEQELAQARAALVRAEEAPLTEQTTDSNPTYQWLQSELARMKTERAAATARAGALAASITSYRDKARRLDEQSSAQQNLIRAAKGAEESYLLYRTKQEEARISDALDRTRIVNVALAEAPTVPSAPAAANRALVLILGAMFALIAGAGAAYVHDSLSPYLRTPAEVERALDLPVLGSMPARR